MSDSSVLREYLISLGFKVDWQGGGKFDSTLTKLDKKATYLSKALLGVGSAALAMTTLFAHQMQKLYYSSQLSGETVDNLQNIAFGAKQVGVGGEQMIAAIEGMQRAIRLNPGLRGLLASLGVDLTKGPAEQLKQFVKVIGKMPSAIGSQYAEMFGIDPDTLLLLSKNMRLLEEAEARRKEMAASLGIDAQAAAELGTQYMRELNEVKEIFGLFQMAAGTALLPTFQEISGVTKEVLKDWIKIAQEVQKVGAGGTFDKLAEGLGIKQPGGGVKLTAEAAKRAGVDQTPRLSFWQAQTAPYKDFWDWVKHGNMYEKPIKNADGTYQPNAAAMKRRQEMAGVDVGKEGKAVWDGVKGIAGRMKEDVLRYGGAKSVTPLGLRQNNPGNLRNWDRGNEEHSNGFVNFDSMEQGLSAMAGNLLVYARRGWDSIQSIVEHWAPQSDGNNTQAYIKNIVKAMGGVDADASLDLRDPETLRLLMAAMIQQEQGMNPFTQADLQKAVQSRLGNTGAPVRVDTTINIHGVSDPREAGNAVVAQQDRVNGDLARDLRGAMR